MGVELDRDNTGKIHDSYINWPWVNVKEIGAKGDGATDDTEAFQEALNYAGTNNRPVFVPNGLYLVTSLREQYNNAYIIGARGGNSAEIVSSGHKTATIKFTTTDSDGLLLMTTNPAWPVRRSVIENINLTGSTTGAALKYHLCDNLELRNCVIDNQGAGVGLDFYNSYLVNVQNVFVTSEAETTINNSTGIRIINAPTILAGLYNFINVTAKNFNANWSFGRNYLPSSIPEEAARIRGINCIGCQAKDGNYGVLAYNGVNGLNWLNGYIEGCKAIGAVVGFGAENVKLSGFWNNPTAGGQISIGNLNGVTGESYYNNVVVEDFEISAVKESGYAIRVRADSSTANSDDVRIHRGQIKAGSTNDGTEIGIILQTGAPIATIEDIAFTGTFASKITQTVKARRIRNAGDDSREISKLTASASVYLNATSPYHQFIEASGVAQAVILPNPALAKGAAYLVRNIGATYNLVIRDYTAGTAYLTLTPGQWALCGNDGTTDYTKLLS